MVRPRGNRGRKPLRQRSCTSKGTVFAVRAGTFEPVTRPNFLKDRTNLLRRGYAKSSISIQETPPPTPDSHLLSCDTQELARLRAISGVGSQSPLTDLGVSTAFEAAVSKG